MVFRTKVFVVLAAFSAVFCFLNCNIPEIYPSYAGTYTLQEAVYEGYEVEDGKPTDLFPAEITVPDVLEIYQRPFNRTNGHNFHILRGTFTTPDLEGILFEQDFSGGGAIKQTLFEYTWEDHTSGPLDPVNGYPCKFATGAEITVRVTPNPVILDKVYPVCQLEQTSSGYVCVQPDQWSDSPVDLPTWEKEELTVTVKYEVYKRKRNVEDTCSKNSYFSRVTATYTLKTRRNMGDPRTRNNPDSNELIQSDTGHMENVVYEALDVDRSDLTNLFPND